MNSWPTSLPQKVLADGFQGAAADGRLRTDTDSTIAKTRRRFSFVPRPLQLQMRMTDEQLAIFRKFVDNDLQGGVLPFIFASVSRTNLFSWSEEFDNAYWNKINSSIVADAAVAPDGTMTMDKLVCNSANTNHGLIRVTAYETGDTLTISFFAKAAEFHKIQINLPMQVGLGFARFDLIAGTASAVTGVGGHASIEDAGNGIYRCSFTITATETLSRQFGVYMLNNADLVIYQGDGTSGVYLWGAQLEAGDRATDYIKTEEASVTVRTGPDGDGTWIAQFGQNMPRWVPTGLDWTVTLDLVVLP